MTIRRFMAASLAVAGLMAACCAKTPARALGGPVTEVHPEVLFLGPIHRNAILYDLIYSCLVENGVYVEVDSAGKLPDKLPADLTAYKVVVADRDLPVIQQADPNSPTRYTVIRAELSPAVSNDEMPDGFVVWGGGEPVVTPPPPAVGILIQSQRQVSKATSGANTVTAKCGDDGSPERSLSLKIYDVTLKVRRNGSGDAWGTTASVAAGKLGTPVHTADVQFITDPPVAGVTLRARVKKGTGQGYPVPIAPDVTGVGSAECQAFGTTGSDGKAVASAAFTSSNMKEDVTLEVPVPGTGTNPVTDPVQVFSGTATIFQKWAQGDNAQWPLSDIFFSGQTDDRPATLLLKDGVTIPHHRLKFFADKVVLHTYTWNSGTGAENEYDETFDYPLSGLPFGLSIHSLITYTNSSEGPDGTYTTTRTATDYYDIVQDENGNDVWREAYVFTIQDGFFDLSVYH